MDSYDAYKLYLGLKAHFEKGNYELVVKNTKTLAKAGGYRK